MRERLMHVVIALAAAISLSASDPARIADPGGVTVHEWGTFTSIAGTDGNAIEWLPLSGPDDLPCFVDRMEFGPKGNLWATVRMETPVLYFYAADDTTVTVKVRFRQGLITEWFPHASVTPAAAAAAPDRGRRLSDREGKAIWTNVRILPGAQEKYPNEQKPSHYYPARETDAAPIQVGSEREKFLFYRGIGGFAPPIVATMAGDGTIAVKNPSGRSLGDMILFQNLRGQVAYQVRDVATGSMTLNPQALAVKSVASLKRDLERILVAHGLYQREAAAMIATWGDAWFEDGTRLLYIVPRQFVDSILPLEVRPVPADIKRVFVGRMELMTASTLEDVKSSLLRDDRAALARYGRFLYPIINRLSTVSPAVDPSALHRGLQFVYSSWKAPLGGCR